MTGSAMLRGLIYSGKDFSHMAPAARSNPFRCPACGLPANNVDGDPFANEPDSLSLVAVIESHISAGCDNGHQWFEAARFGRDGGVIDRTTGMAGAKCPWVEQPGNAAEPPSVLCTVCMDSGTEFTEEGPQPCTNRIHEEVKDG